MMRGSSPSPRPSLLRGLPERAYLTIKHHGWRDFLYRLVTAPLRLVGLEAGVRARLLRRAELRRIHSWYAENWRPVTVIIPSYGDPKLTIAAVKSLRRTTDPGRTRIVVVDDGSELEHQKRLHGFAGAEVVLSVQNGGYSTSINRGLEHAGEHDDIVVANNDILAEPGWLEAMQRAAYVDEQSAAGIVGPRLLYPDGRIQSAGSYRNLGAPDWFDHRYRFKPADHGPAEVAGLALAVTGACMYIRRDVLTDVGPFDEEYRMGFEDVDYCLRAWEAGHTVRYEPGSVLTHLESTTRGIAVGEREQSSQARFWTRWGPWFDERNVRTPDGELRVIYVTEDTGIGGGHRDIFEHLNRLQARGYSVALYSLGGPPDWFPLEAPVHSFETYAELSAALEHEQAIKVATWWRTAEWVWRASVRHGLPVFFVQDLETSYYGGHGWRAQRARAMVLASYREEFRYMTIAQCTSDRLAGLGLQADLIPPGIDLDNFRQTGVERRGDMVLAIGRSNPLKNFPLTVEAWRRLESRAELCLFGIEPELRPRGNSRYVEAPTDAEVTELLNQASVFVQTSVHEGFCLPALEAMAAGTPVVCTDANGNRDFCRHEVNCLMVEADPEAVAAAIERVLDDPALRSRLVAAGLETAQDYAWDRRIDQLEGFLSRVAGDDSPAVDTTPLTRRAGGQR